ncbi:PA1571 family protein [Marinobacter sp. SS21]|uniref:PA1571 family protein n=1 Tax=Marinobacter sp. SS21 TaxID=2979460 RepID=UPI002FEE0F4D
MREGNTVLQQKQSPESWMNGAAIVLSDGREIPITETMVRLSLEALLNGEEKASERRATA